MPKFEWCVDSIDWLTLTPYRTRRFRHRWAAQAFITLRAVFYLMPHAFPNWAVLRRG